LNFESESKKTKSENDDPVTLEEILSAGEKKFTAKQKAEAIYDSWKKKNNAHDRDRAIKNLVTLQTGKEKVPFHKLLAAFDNYTRQADRRKTEAQYRKTCANFFGRDRTWTTYADEIPPEPTTSGNGNGNGDAQTEDPIFDAIVQNVNRLRAWAATGGMTANREEIVAAIGEEVFEIALAMSRLSWFKKWNDMKGDAAMIESIIQRNLPTAYEQAKNKIEKATEKKDNG